VGLRERIVAYAPPRNPAIVLAVLVAALVVLSILLVAGSLTRVDQFSVDHWMPWLNPRPKHHGGSVGLYRPFSLDTTTWAKVLDTWTYPCSVLISALIVMWAAIALWPRYGPVVALAPAAAWIIGNGIEVIGKGTLTRPPLYGSEAGARVHILAFDASFPSGHTIRGVVVAFAIALMFTRWWKWVLVWCLLVGPALVLQSAHTLTDVIGGALIGLILLVLMLSVVRAESRVER
jgi:membrane-associated phospholipid phosphatase